MLPPAHPLDCPPTHPLPRTQAALEADDKLAPEWQGVLQELEHLQLQLERLKRQGASSTALQAAAEEAAATQHVAAEWDAAHQQLLVGALVTFPRRMALLTQAAQQLQQVEDAGAAAEADWGPLLRRQFGARVRRGGASSALVLAPAQQLPAVLDWLAQRPAVLWVAPAAVARAANWRAAAVAQVGLLVGWWTNTEARLSVVRGRSGWPGKRRHLPAAGVPCNAVADVACKASLPPPHPPHHVVWPWPA